MTVADVAGVTPALVDDIACECGRPLLTQATEQLTSESNADLNLSVVTVKCMQNLRLMRFFGQQS